MTADCAEVYQRRLRTYEVKEMIDAFIYIFSSGCRRFEIW